MGEACGVVRIGLGDWQDGRGREMEGISISIRRVERGGTDTGRQKESGGGRFCLEWIGEGICTAHAQHSTSPSRRCCGKSLSQNVSMLRFGKYYRLTAHDWP